jgi:hypothetical protein
VWASPFHSAGKFSFQALSYLSYPTSETRAIPLDNANQEMVNSGYQQFDAALEETGWVRLVTDHIGKKFIDSFFSFNNLFLDFTQQNQTKFIQSDSDCARDQASETMPCSETQNSY